MSRNLITHRLEEAEPAGPVRLVEGREERRRQLSVVDRVSVLGPAGSPWFEAGPARPESHRPGLVFSGIVTIRLGSAFNIGLRWGNQTTEGSRSGACGGPRPFEGGG